jgi:hypothetical protein
MSFVTKATSSLCRCIVGRSDATVTRWLLAGSVCALLVGCDPGYGFTVHNRCDAAIKVQFFDSNEFDRAIPSRVRYPTTIPPHSDTTWSTIDPDIEAPFGLLLIDGPRAGDLLKSATPEVAIPMSACPE